MARNAVALNVSGMPELKAQLDRLSKRMGRAALERAGLEAAEPTARLMRSLAPKDTGELAESIDVGVRATSHDEGAKAYQRTMKAGGTQEQAVSALRSARRAQSAQTYATVFIGPVAGRAREDVIKGYVQEFGTARMEPNSYIRAGFEQDKGALMERLKENIRFEVFAAIEKAQRLGRLRG
jgi:hypothetical protein